MMAALLAAKPIIAFVIFSSLFVAERLAPASPAPHNYTRLFRNGVLAALVIIASPLIVLPLTALAAEAPLWRRPEWLLGAAGGALSLLALDLWTYGVHRAYHESPFLWRFHAVHHYDERLDTTSALRFHLGEIAISATLRMAPITLLAIPVAHAAVFELLLFASAVFHHSNVRLPTAIERALSWVIVTPSIHWVHHHAIRDDTDANYSSLLSLWDRLFGTRSDTQRTQEMKIGVEGVEEKPLLRLMLSPFRSKETA